MANSKDNTTYLHNPASSGGHSHRHNPEEVGSYRVISGVTPIDVIQRRLAASN